MSDLEERVTRLELILDGLIAEARKSSFGRALLRKLGLS